jgi:hypothetical protein
MGLRTGGANNEARLSVSIGRRRVWIATVVGLVLTACGAPDETISADSEIEAFILREAPSYAVSMDEALSQRMTGYVVAAGMVTITTPISWLADGPCCPERLVEVCSRMVGEAEDRGIRMTSLSFVDSDGAMVATSHAGSVCYPPGE